MLGAIAMLRYGEDDKDNRRCQDAQNLHQPYGKSIGTTGVVELGGGEGFWRRRVEVNSTSPSLH